MDYQAFLQSKQRKLHGYGFEPTEVNRYLFDWQRDVVKWAVRRGRAALFEDCGLGKTLQQLAWAEQVIEHLGGPVIIHCPLGVRHQTKREAERFEICVNVVVADTDGDVDDDGINLVNYEKLEHFRPERFTGVVLDESSILKAYTGATKRRLIDAYRNTPCRLACTATPAPNDHMELGNHSEFLGVMPSNEMLARWFVNDTMKAGGYRLRGHAVSDFWAWVASWAICISKPSDLGFNDDGFILPALHVSDHIVHAPPKQIDGMLFDAEPLTATTVHQEKRRSAGLRAAKVAEIVAEEPGEAWLIWCDTNYESDELVAAIPDAIEIRGSHSERIKEERLRGFSDGDIRILVTKPDIAGFGMNWQHCARVAFIGLGYSFERYYQAVRRVWRFGQHRDVHVYIVAGDGEHALAATVRRKEREHEQMRHGMSAAMRQATLAELGIERQLDDYDPQTSGDIPRWLLHATTQQSRKTTHCTEATAAKC